MNKVAALSLLVVLFSCPTVFGQDAMKYGVKHLTVLAEDQKALSERFALPGSGKFESVPVLTGPGGLPLLEGALAHVECRIWADYPGGDHTIYLGEVEHVQVFGGRPLLFHGSLYLGLKGEGAGA